MIHEEFQGFRLTMFFQASASVQVWIVRFVRAIETNVKTVDTASESSGDSPLPHELLVVAKGGLDNLAVHYIFRNLNLENGFDDVNTTQSTYKKGLSCVRINFLREVGAIRQSWNTNGNLGPGNYMGQKCQRGRSTVSLGSTRLLGRRLLKVNHASSGRHTTGRKCCFLLTSRCHSAWWGIGGRHCDSRGRHLSSWWGIFLILGRRRLESVLGEELPLEEELLQLLRIEYFLNRLAGSRKGIDSSDDDSKSLRLFFFLSAGDMDGICETESQISCA